MDRGDHMEGLILYLFGMGLGFIAGVVLGAIIWGGL